MLRVADENGRQKLVGELAASAVQRTDHRSAVETIGDGLSDKELVHRRDGLVDADEADVGRRPVEQLQPRIALDRCGIAYERLVEALDRPSFQRTQARQPVDDRAKDEPVEPRLLPPIVRISYQDDVPSRSPRLKHEGTG